MISERNASLMHAQYYAGLLLRADQLYDQGGALLEDGLRIFDDNWKNIEIGQNWSAKWIDSDEEAATLASEFPERGARCLYLRQKPAERIAWLKVALHVAHLRGFELVEGVLHGKIGVALSEMGDYKKAIEHYSIRLELAEKLSDFEGLGEGACNLGILYDSLNMLEPAQECYQYALDMAAKISDSKITEKATGNLGLVYLKLGENARAMECFEQHLRLARQNGDQWSEGNALTNLGIACLKLQNYDQASAYFHESILINKKLGDLDGEAKNLGYIGAILGAIGDLDGAVFAFQERIVLAKKLKDDCGEAIGCWNLGEILVRQKKYRLGLEFLYKCIEYEKGVGDPAWEDDVKAVRTIEETYGSVKG